MAQIIKVKKLLKGEYEITHEDGHIHIITKSALEVAIKVKKKEIAKGKENLTYKELLLKEIKKVE